MRQVVLWSEELGQEWEKKEHRVVRESWGQVGKEWRGRQVRMRSKCMGR